MDPKWTMKKAMFVLVGSSIVTLLFSFGSYSVYGKWKKTRYTSDRYKIAVIVQTGPEREALKTVYLAELMGLSSDAPKNVFLLDLKKAEKALLASPLISKAKVKRLPPNTLYVDYEVRKPVAFLADYRNLAIDRDGYLFPVEPFLSPKEIPEIYLGLPAFGAPADRYGREGGSWQKPVGNRYSELAFQILQTFEGSPWKEGLRIKRIDVSNAYAPTLGRREIVIFTEEEISLRKDDRELSFTFPKILRLAPRDFAHQLQNFFALRRSMIEDYRRQLATVSESTRFAPRIVDLRVPQLAFVESHNTQSK